jgi:hypothetical protein
MLNIESVKRAKAEDAHLRAEFGKMNYKCNAKIHAQEFIEISVNVIVHKYK